MYRFSQQVRANIPPDVRSFLHGCADIIATDGPLPGSAGQFINSIAKLTPLGIAVPDPEGPYSDAVWWYFIYRWDRELPKSTEIIAARKSWLTMESDELRDVSMSYAQVLTRYDQVQRFPFWITAGFLGPFDGVGLGGFVKARSSIGETRTAHGLAGDDLSADVGGAGFLNDLLPIMADGLGNYYLIERGRDKKAVYFFDHESGRTTKTTTLEDLLTTFWSKPELYL
jgi:hypothetical protein